MSINSRKGKSIVKKRSTVGIEIDNFSPVSFSIEQAFNHFIALKKTIGVRKRTMTDYYTLMKYFRDWLSETYPEAIYITDINTTIIRDYIVYLKEERFNEKTNSVGLSPFTINVRIRFLKTFFNAMYKEELINKNPVVNIQLMKVDEDAFEPLNEDELKGILSIPDDREYAQFRDLVMMYLMLDTGMRISEVCELEVSEVDFKTRSIILPSSKNKNRKPRILPLSNQVVKLLLELVSENKANFDANHVFLSNIGSKYNSNSFRKRLSIYKNKAGIKKRVSPHVFRHQFCRDFILNGGDIFTLQRIVGHADITTTRKYIQLDNENIRNQHSLYSPVLRLRRR